LKCRRTAACRATAWRAFVLRAATKHRVESSHELLRSLSLRSRQFAGCIDEREECCDAGALKPRFAAEAVSRRFGVRGVEFGECFRHT
jgi:hypothetical protein